jgi:hypothetical protein
MAEKELHYVAVLDEFKSRNWDAEKRLALFSSFIQECDADPYSWGPTANSFRNYLQKKATAEDKPPQLSFGWTGHWEFDKTVPMSGTLHADDMYDAIAKLKKQGYVVNRLIHGSNITYVDNMRLIHRQEIQALEEEIAVRQTQIAEHKTKLARL